MKKGILIAGTMVLFLIGVFVFRPVTSSESGGQLHTLKVGVLIPETGPLAFLGNPMRSAIELAQSDFKEVLKESGLRIDIHWGDSKGMPAETVTALNQMVAPASNASP